MDDAPLIAIVIWTLMAAGFTLLGIYGLRHPDRLADFFTRPGRELFGKAVAEHVYTKENQRWALVSFVIIGPICVIVGTSNILSRVLA